MIFLHINQIKFILLFNNFMIYHSLIDYIKEYNDK